MKRILCRKYKIDCTNKLKHNNNVYESKCFMPNLEKKKNPVILFIRNLSRTIYQRYLENSEMEKTVPVKCDL